MTMLHIDEDKLLYLGEKPYHLEGTRHPQLLKQSLKLDPRLSHTPWLVTKLQPQALKLVGILKAPHRLERY